MLITFWIGLAILTFLIARRLLTRRGWDITTILRRRAAPPTLPTPKRAPSPQPSPKFSPNTLSAPALSRANSSLDGSQSVAFPQPLLGPQAFRPRVPWSQAPSSLRPDTPSGPISRSPSSRSPSPIPVSSLRPPNVPSRPSSPSLVQPSMPPTSESAPVLQLPIAHIPSHEDVIETRDVLRHFLPLELADKILHIAEYYPRLISVLPSHHFENPLTVSDGRRQVVVSPPILRPDSISSVLIQTESHDQGWSSYPQDRGTFRNSWTWLDLGVVRNTSGGIPAPEWRIYTNVHASNDWQATEVVLDTTNETVDALLPGDSLAIWAGARFPGWQNNVRSGKIEVTYKI